MSDTKALIERLERSSGQAAELAAKIRRGGIDGRSVCAELERYAVELELAVVALKASAPMTNAEGIRSLRLVSEAMDRAGLKPGDRT